VTIRGLPSSKYWREFTSVPCGWGVGGEKDYFTSFTLGEIEKFESDGSND
jgi:hypothetical protein